MQHTGWGGAPWKTPGCPVDGIENMFYSADDVTEASRARKEVG